MGETLDGERSPLAGPGTKRPRTTVLFTDIVGSTELAVRLGDAA